MLDLAGPAFKSAPRSLIWLAGLLEGEGTFLRPPPSSPNCPIVSCRMTDRDVVERVARLFGTSTVSIDKGRFRTEYGAIIKGSRAVTLMRELQPLMGKRRCAAIYAAIHGYSPPQRKLDFNKAEQIRRRRRGGESVSSLSRSYGVARQTLHPILKNLIYLAPESTPWRDAASFLRNTGATPDGISMPEFLCLQDGLRGRAAFAPHLPQILAARGFGEYRGIRTWFWRQPAYSRSNRTFAAIRETRTGHRCGAR